MCSEYYKILNISKLGKIFYIILLYNKFNLMYYTKI